jgi:hypothetical protein
MIYEAGIHSGKFSSKYIVQDIITKREDTVSFLNWIDENLGVYPLWLLPLKPEENSKLTPSYLETDLAINVGIWGEPQAEGEPEELKTLLEQKQKEIGARKTLYAQQFYSKDEFWEQYNREWYQNLRKKYGADGSFPSVYEVTHVDELPEPSKIKMLTALGKNILKLD